VSEVVGLENGSAEEIVRYIKKHCGGVELYDEASKFDIESVSGKKVVVRSTFDALPNVLDERRDMLADNGKCPHLQTHRQIKHAYKKW